MIEENNHMNEEKGLNSDKEKEKGKKKDNGAIPRSIENAIRQLTRKTIEKSMREQFGDKDDSNRNN